MVNIVADGFAQRRDRGFITRFQLGKRLFRGQTGGLVIHDSLLVSGLLTFPIVCHSGKRAKGNLSVSCEDTQLNTGTGAGLDLFAGVCPARAAIMAGVADLQCLRRIIIQTITRIGQRCEFIPFPQAEATGFNLSDHLPVRRSGARRGRGWTENYPGLFYPPLHLFFLSW